MHESLPKPTCPRHPRLSKPHAAGSPRSDTSLRLQEWISNLAFYGLWPGQAAQERPSFTLGTGARMWPQGPCRRRSVTGHRGQPGSHSVDGQVPKVLAAGQQEVGRGEVTMRQGTAIDTTTRAVRAQGVTAQGQGQTGTLGAVLGHSGQSHSTSNIRMGTGLSLSCFTSGPAP